MTVLCLHGLVSSTAVPPDNADLPQHQLLTLGSVQAVVSQMTCQLDDAESTMTALLAHDRLLGAYLQHGAVLPVRFGTAFSGAGAIRAELAPKSPRLASQIEQLEDLVEYAMTVFAAGDSAHESPASVARSGRAFLAARKARRDMKADRALNRRQRLEQIHGIALRHAARSDLRPPHPSRLLSVSLLMSPIKAEYFLSEINNLNRTCGLEVRLTGPYPPYSFAEVSIRDERMEARHDA